MGLQRIVADVYYSHEGAVDVAKEVDALLCSKGMTPTALSVTNHPGEADESTTKVR